MKRIDLHTHSTASDGTLIPSGIIDMAEKLDLAAVALTDHDTVSGLKEFMLRAADSVVHAIPGVEIASLWKTKEVHILGFWINPDSEELLKLLGEIRSNRDKRNMSIISRLNENGYSITSEELNSISKGESIGRPHIASLLVEKGYFKSIKEVFNGCLSKGGTSYAQRILPEPKQVIDIIHKSGGIAIWAHPLHRNTERTNIKSNLIQLKNWGLDGVECYYSEYNERHQKKMLKYANDIGLQVSGGSDFHGTNLHDISMGSGFGSLFIPETVYENLVKYREETQDL